MIEVRCLPGQGTFVTSTSGVWKTCRTWSGAANGQFLLETSHARDSRKRQSVGGHGFTCHNLENISSYVKLGDVSSVEARLMLQECWFKYYRCPMAVMTDPEGCFREDTFQRMAGLHQGVASWSSGQSVGCHQTFGHASCTTCTSRHVM